MLVLAALLALPAVAGARGKGRAAVKQQVPRGSWNARLLSHKSYRKAFSAASEVLRRQPGLVRLDRKLPTIVIPDLHGRRDYLDAVLANRDPRSGKTYLKLLRQKKVQVICLGDVMHTEIRGTLWRRGMQGRAMRKEMAESLGTLKRIAELKVAYPENFHLLRGNHDDVGPARGTAGKLPRQIKQTRGFVESSLGTALLKDMAGLFGALPVAAAGKGFFASHSNPMVKVTRREVERKAERATISLTRARLPSFNVLRRDAPTRDATSVLQQVTRALGGDPKRDMYIHGHLWAKPMTVDGKRVFFGHPSNRTYLRLDPGETVAPWKQMYDASTNRRVRVEGVGEEGSGSRSKSKSKSKSRSRSRSRSQARVIGLTGGIASGKSTVTRMLRQLGAPVVDADKISRRIVEPGRPAYRDIVRTFGREVLSPDGTIDRKRLGAQVFADAGKLAALNRITHPRIDAEARKQIRRHAKAGARTVFYDAALIVEQGLHKRLDGVVVVNLPKDVQLSRLMTRNKLSSGEARQRIDSQLPLSAKLKVADHVIDNSGSLARTRGQVKRLWETLNH